MTEFRQASLEVLQDTLSVIAKDFAQQAADSVGDFALVEEAVRVSVLRAREAMVSAGLRISASESGKTYFCPVCSKQMYNWSLDARRVVTAEGEGTYLPIRYRCKACSQDYYPVEEANGLHGSSFTTGAKLVIAESGASQPFAHVSRSLGSQRGLCVSAKEVDRTVREVAEWRAEEEADLAGAAFGQDAALKRDAGVDPLSQVPALHGFSKWPAGAAALLSVDGAMIRSTSKGPDGLEWFECRAAVLQAIGDHKRPAKFYTGGVCTPDALFDQLAASWRKAVPRGCVSVFVADGARWIWDRVRLYFPDAIQVLDYYHACEHVGSAAAACFGERSPEASAWRESARKRLKQAGGPRAVMHDLLNALRHPEQTADRDRLRTEIRYLFAHRHRMRYHQLVGRGLPIGSGAMESGIKQLASARLRMPGMKWTRAGADAVLRIRGAHLSQSLRDTAERRHVALRKTAADRYARPQAMAA